ncbi:hypothetical protein [Acidilobus sp.]
MLYLLPNITSRTLETMSRKAISIADPTIADVSPTRERSTENVVGRFRA